jgi:hypothetical protein
MNDELKRGPGLIEVLSRNFPRGTEEKRGKVDS